MTPARQPKKTDFKGKCCGSGSLLDPYSDTQLNKKFFWCHYFLIVKKKKFKLFFSKLIFYYFFKIDSITRIQIEPTFWIRIQIQCIWIHNTALSSVADSKLFNSGSTFSSVGSSSYDSFSTLFKTLFLLFSNKNCGTVPPFFRVDFDTYEIKFIIFTNNK